MDYQDWCKKSDKQIADEKAEHQKLRGNAKNAYQKFIEEYREKNGDYWKYGDIYVPLEIGSIPAIDKVNSVSLMDFGSSSHIVTTAVYSTLPDYTTDEYHNKFCKFDDETNRWIYVGRSD